MLRLVGREDDVVARHDDGEREDAVEEARVGRLEHGPLRGPRRGRGPEEREEGPGLAVAVGVVRAALADGLQRFGQRREVAQDVAAEGRDGRVGKRERQPVEVPAVRHGRDGARVAVCCVGRVHVDDGRIPGRLPEAAVRARHERRKVHRDPERRHGPRQVRGPVVVGMVDAGQNEVRRHRRVGRRGQGLVSRPRGLRGARGEDDASPARAALVERADPALGEHARRRHEHVRVAHEHARRRLALRRRELRPPVVDAVRQLHDAHPGQRAEEDDGRRDDGGLAPEARGLPAIGGGGFPGSSPTPGAATWAAILWFALFVMQSLVLQGIVQRLAICH